MNFTAWLQGWLTRHPLREPSDGDRARYTAEVMARVRVLQPSAVGQSAWIRRWLAWPRLTLAMAAAAAGVALVVGPLHQRRLAQGVVRDAAVLASLGEATAEPLVIEDEESLREEMEELDALVVAEASSLSDEQWMMHTLELLQDLGEEASGDAPDAAADSEEWSEQLEFLDEGEWLSAS